MTDSQVRVRYAPSPTGKLHIGGARTALFNWAYARRLGGVFVLRIEDTDRERSSQEYEDSILDAMRWLGLDWDEGPGAGGDFGPYRQTERADRHLGVAAMLQQAGWAYPCFCSAERLAELREGQMERKEKLGYDGHCRDLSPEEVRARIDAGEEPVLRFRVPEGETIEFKDHIRGDVKVATADIDDWVMVRGGGSPTYNFVCVVDDSDMQITHVVRGEDHLTNTPKQILLFRALGLPVPEYAHLPLMLGKDKKKLSKRTGDTALQDYRDNGYPAESVLNFLALQGWALDGENDVFSVDDLLANFELKDVSKGGAVFDPEKFRWMSGEYIRKDTPERLAERCAPHVAKAGLTSEDDLRSRWDWFVKAVTMEQERIELYSDLAGRIAYLFAADDAVEYAEKAEKGARKHEARIETLQAYAKWVEPKIAGDFDPAALGQETKDWVKERGLKIPGLFQPLRCALSGLPGGPDLFETIALLGAPATLARIDAALNRLA